MSCCAYNSFHLLNQSFVNLHFPQIPSLGTLAVGSLTSRDLEDLGWEANRAFDAEVLGLSTVDEFGADLLEGLDVLGGEGDADLVDFLQSISDYLHRACRCSYRALAEVLVTTFVVRHLC